MPWPFPGCFTAALPTGPPGGAPALDAGARQPAPVSRA
jgi:hypothetical protein